MATYVFIGDSGHDPFAALDAKLDRILAGLYYTQETQEEIMLDLSGLEDAVAYDTEVDTSAVNLIQFLADQLANAPDQAAVDAIVDQMRTKADEIAAFVVANTPADTDAGTDTGTEGTAPGTDTTTTPGGPVTDTPTGVDPITGEAIDEDTPA